MSRPFHSILLILARGVLPALFMLISRPYAEAQTNPGQPAADMAHLGLLDDLSPYSSLYFAVSKQIDITSLSLLPYRPGEVQKYNRFIPAEKINYKPILR